MEHHGVIIAYKGLYISVTIKVKSSSNTSINWELYPLFNMDFYNLPLKQSLVPGAYTEMARSLACTIWFFTCQDIKTTVVPSIGFALVNSIAFRQLPLVVFITRLPVLLLWIYLNLLAFTAHNQ